MNFQETEAYLYSLGNEVETMKLGLENITALLDALGQPYTKYKKVQVAGTNGKGSVCAFLNSICLEAGIRTGLYTSPHLVSIIERIKIDDDDIAEEEFARLATTVRETAERLTSSGELGYLPTFFEQVTAIALLAFAVHNVDLAILETGLGGRFDATTAANAEIAAITRIDLDHQEYLGETIEDIAAEKAAIIRADSIAVVGDQSPLVLKLLLDRCNELGLIARTKCEAGVWAVDMLNMSAVMFFQTDNAVYTDPNLGLKGRHQIENARIAILVAETLRYDLDFKISVDNVVEGIENARHPGRIEWIGKYLLDGAHNPAGAKALRTFLDEFVSGPITLVFGAMNDKKVAEIGKLLWPKATWLVLTQPSNSRAMSVEDLRQHLPEEIESENVLVSESVQDALAIAKSVSSDETTILVTGSLYLVGEVRRILVRG